MGTRIQQSSRGGVWELCRRQHGVVSRRQLIALGYTAKAIRHRVATRRLHPLWRGVYAVGRPEVTQHGLWMAAVLACGSGAVVSHQSACELWELRPLREGPIHIAVIGGSDRRRPGIAVHRRLTLSRAHIRHRHGIPVTSPICTLIDSATILRPDELEAAVNEADKRDLVDPDRLRVALDAEPGRPGVAVLRRTLDRPTFSLTDSELERRFLPIAGRAGLPPPETQRHLHGFRVDFYWPALGLVVETDGLRYHRTPAQQARDRLRDQALSAAGLTVIRFTRAQVRFDATHVQATLAAVAQRLSAIADSKPV